MDETKAAGDIVIIHKSKKYRVIGSIAKVFKKKAFLWGDRNWFESYKTKSLQRYNQS